MTIPDKKNPKNPIVIVEPDQGNRTYFLVPSENMKTLFCDIQKYIVLDNSSNTWTLHAEISIIPIGTSSTSISKEVAAAFDAIRKTKGIKTTNLTAMGTHIDANNMRAVLNAIDAAHQAVKSSGAKRLISTIRFA